jgi:hypothetical protein
VQCRSAEPRTDNTETPVRVGYANVNMDRRAARPRAVMSPEEPEGDSSVMEVSYTDNHPHNTTPLDNGLDVSRASDMQLLVAELRLFREEMRRMSLEIHALRTAMSSLTARIDGCDGRIDALCARVESLESRPQPNNVTAETALVDTISQLRLELNDRDQELLLNDIEISNVPETNGENAMHLVTTLGQKLGVTLTEHDIVDATRVGRVPQLERGQGPAPRPRPLVVRLARRAVRDRMHQAARVRRDITTEGAGIPGRSTRFYVNERLTPHNRRLLYKARELKQQLGWRYVWTRDGKIFARQQAGMDSPRHRIRTEPDLNRVFGLRNV